MIAELDMFKDTFEISELVKDKTNRKLDSIVLYDRVFNYPNEPHIQYLDSYKSDFVFVNEFPKVMESMSKVLNIQEFREMLKCAVQTNLKLYNDGELLNPEAGRILQQQWQGYLFKNFLGKESDNYIIRGDYFKGEDSVSRIKDSLDRNIALSTEILSRVKTESDYREPTDRSFINWLMSYNRSAALSKKYD